MYSLLIKNDRGRGRGSGVVSDLEVFSDFQVLFCNVIRDVHLTQDTHDG